MNRIFTCIVSLVMTLSLVSQSSSQAEALFKKQDFEGAAQMYKSLVKRYPTSALYNYRYARCVGEMGDTQLAIRHFEKAGERYALRNFYLGELYFEVYRFDEAIEAYEKYIKKIDEDDERIPSLMAKMEKAEYAARLLRRVEDVVIVDSVVVDKAEFLSHYRLPHEAGVLKQWQVNVNDSTRTDVVSYTTQRQDRKYTPQLRDGQLDIHTQFKLMDSWGDSKSLSDQVNTEYNENFPFFLSDGVTLYFASDRKESLGGYDIFITRYNVATDSYLQPENVGMPFNSMANDYMMAFNEVENWGCFATDRHQDPGQVIIYTFVPNEVKKFVKSDDAQYVANVAQLKTYRRASRLVTQAPKSQPTIAPKPVQEEKNKMEFFVRDNLVYHNISDFKSKDAYHIYLAYTKMNRDLTTGRKSLVTLREEYAQAQPANRQVIASKIVELEVALSELDMKVKNLEIEIRNEEIKYLQKEL